MCVCECVRTYVCACISCEGGHREDREKGRFGLNRVCAESIRRLGLFPFFNVWESRI